MRKFVSFFGVMRSTVDTCRYERPNASSHRGSIGPPYACTSVIDTCLLPRDMADAGPRTTQQNP